MVFDFCSNNYKLDEYKKESFNRSMRKAPSRVITVTEFQKASCGDTDKYLKIANGCLNLLTKF